MDQKILTFDTREEKRKGPARRLRREGRIPSIVYGHNEPVCISIDAHEFRTKFKRVSESAIITLKNNDTTYDVLVKDYQTDTMRGNIMHIDFYEIEKGKVLKTRVVVHFTGTPVGVKEGGLLETLIHDVEVECLPKDLPSDMSIDISDLEIGQSVHVRDLPVVEDVRILTSSDQVICTLLRKREEILEVEEEELEEGELPEEEGEEEETEEEE